MLIHKMTVILALDVVTFGTGTRGTDLIQSSSTGVGRGA